MVRMSGEERREQIIAAATSVFAEKGFAATTDDVARAAGVSQPYVVRIFGTKRALVAEVFTRVTDQIVGVFDKVKAGPTADAELGTAYVALMLDSDLLRVVLQGFLAGADPDLGRQARHVLSEAFRIHSERTGMGPTAAREFVAQGMLITVLLATRAAEHVVDEPEIAPLVSSSLGDMLMALQSGRPISVDDHTHTATSRQAAATDGARRGPDDSRPESR